MDYIQQVVDSFGSVGTCHLIDNAGYRLMSVYRITEGIGQTSQLDAGYIAQTKNFAVRLCLDDNVFEFFGLLQTSFVTDGILESLLTTFTKLSRSSFDVLFGQGIGDIGRNQVILSHDIRLQPDTHRVILSHHSGITHTFHTLKFRNQVDLGVVFHKLNVILVFRIVQREDQQHRVLTFLGCDTDFGNFGRQQTLCHRNTVLNVDRSHIRVGTLVEVHTDFGRTVVCRTRLNIHHVLYTIDLVFQRCND